tara:strand:+ start:11123 stop:11350 length:228 start_codon:yes stop_codon:yes gene_type:complete
MVCTLSLASIPSVILLKINVLGSALRHLSSIISISAFDEAHPKLDARHLGAPLAPLSEYSQNHVVSVIDLFRYKQ